MVGRPRAGPAPRDYAVANTGVWPYCRISGPIYAHAFAAFARRLDEQRQGQNYREFADASGIDVNVLSRISRGETWGNAITFLKVCTTLNIDVIGSSHLSVYRTSQLVEDFAAHVGRPELGDAPYPARRGAGRVGPSVPREVEMYLPESETAIDIKMTRNDNPSGWFRLLPKLADEASQWEQLTGNPRSMILFLFPGPPPQEARTWLRQHGIGAIYRTSQGFDDTFGGALIEAIASKRKALPT